jgi:small conductance mechanosensitive channel
MHLAVPSPPHYLTSMPIRLMPHAMRRLSLALVAIALLWVSPAWAQSVAAHQAAPAQAAAAPATTPAQGLASTIIPGSPLAARTGAAPAAAAPPGDVFGTESLGLSLMAQAAREASFTIREFASAVRRSTQLTEVSAWLQSFPTSTDRQLRAITALKGIAITLLPAWLVEIIIRVLLTRPRAGIISIALARRQAELPDDPADAGIALAEAGETEPPPRRRPALGAWLSRLGLAFGYIILALLPLLGFFIASSVLIGGRLLLTGGAQLIIVGAANAYVFCRILNEALKFILAPKHPTLRLIHTTSRRAGWLVNSLMVIIITIALGYTLIATAQTLGLAHEGALVLARLVALAVHIELAVLVWQSRHIVAGWIRGRAAGHELTFGIRARLAAIWHYVALFYLIALWVAYAGGIQDAFAVLLRIIAVFIGVLMGGRVAWLGYGQVLDYFFDIPDDEPRPLAALRRRARLYNPFLRLVARLVIFALMLILLLAGWGVPVIPLLLKTPISLALISAAIDILITITIALVLWELANFMIAARIDRLSAAGHTRQASRLRTLLPMLKATLGGIIFLTAGLICLAKIGFNLVPLLAVSGVAGIAIGFGSQKLVQDIITGLFLLLEDAMQVGDVITLASMTGTVERLSIRTIRLRGGDGSINIIPFSAVTTVTNMTRDFGYAQISIQVGYEEDLPRVYAVMTDVARTMRTEPAWGAMMRDDLQIFGLDQFGASALVITGQIRTGPGQHWSVRREFYGRIKQRFEAEHIDMPYTYLAPAPPRPAAEPPQIAAAGQPKLAAAEQPKLTTAEQPKLTTAAPPKT